MRRADGTRGVRWNARGTAKLLAVASLVGAVGCGVTGDEPPGGDPKMLASATLAETAAALPSPEAANFEREEASGAATDKDRGIVASEVTYGDAEKVFRSGRYEEAAALFDAYTQRKPENVWGHYMFGISAWKALDHETAESALLRALEIEPEHPKSLINLSRVLLEQNRPAAALDYAEDAVVVTPESVDAWRVLGNVRSSLGEIERAEDAYQRALVSADRDAWSMNNLGLLMIRSGRYEEAIPPLAHAVELKPETPAFQNNLGVALERTGHLVEAAEAFRAALDVNPEYGKAKASLERVEERIASGDWTPIDLPSMARTFADQVEFWRETAAMEAKIAEPMDTVKRGNGGSN